MNERHSSRIYTLSFDEWVEYCFNRPERDWWFSATDPEIDNYIPEHAEVSAHMTQLCRESAQALSRYSDNQISYGVWYCFGIGSSYVGEILDHEEAPEAFYEAIPSLYRDTFEVRCSGNPDLETDLDTAVYMLWDMDGIEFPLRSKSSPKRLRDGAFRAVERIFTETTNPVCHGSALHALWECQGSHPRWKPLIDSIIESNSYSHGIREAARGILEGKHP